MFQINTVDAVGGLFVDGNPQTGQVGTQVPAAWLNDLMMNVCNAVTHAGIPLAQGDYNQLTNAIIEIATGIAGAGAGVGSVPTTLEINTEGLITGGQGLNSNVTLNVPKSSSAEIIAGTNATDVITPDILAALFGVANPASVPSEVTLTFPGGFMLKMGTYMAPMNGEGSFNIPFVTPFPHACISVNATGVNLSANNYRDVWPQRVSKNAAGFVVFNQSSAGGSVVVSLDGIEYMCLGL